MAASSNVRSVEEQIWEIVQSQAALQAALQALVEDKQLEVKRKREELEAKRKPKKSGWKIAWKIAKFLLKIVNEECKVIGNNLDKGIGDMINPATWKDLGKSNWL